MEGKAETLKYMYVNKNHVWKAFPKLKKHSIATQAEGSFLDPN